MIVDKLLYHYTLSVKPKLTKFSKSQIVNFEEDYELICDVIEANPQPTITWEYQVSTCPNDVQNCEPLKNSWNIASKVNS